MYPHSTGSTDPCHVSAGLPAAGAAQSAASPTCGSTRHRSGSSFTRRDALRTLIATLRAHTSASSVWLGALATLTLLRAHDGADPTAPRLLSPDGKLDTSCSHASRVIAIARDTFRADLDHLAAAGAATRDGETATVNLDWLEGRRARGRRDGSGAGGVFTHHPTLLGRVARLRVVDDTRARQRGRRHGRQWRGALGFFVVLRHLLARHDDRACLSWRDDHDNDRPMSLTQLAAFVGIERVTTRGYLELLTRAGLLEGTADVGWRIADPADLDGLQPAPASPPAPHRRTEATTGHTLATQPPRAGESLTGRSLSSSKTTHPRAGARDAAASGDRREGPQDATTPNPATAAARHPTTLPHDIPPDDVRLVVDALARRWPSLRQTLAHPDLARQIAGVLARTGAPATRLASVLTSERRAGGAPTQPATWPPLTTAHYPRDALLKSRLPDAEQQLAAWMAASARLERDRQARRAAEEADAAERRHQEALTAQLAALDPSLRTTAEQRLAAELAAADPSLARNPRVALFAARGQLRTWARSALAAAPGRPLGEQLAEALADGRPLTADPAAAAPAPAVTAELAAAPPGEPASQTVQPPPAGQASEGQPTPGSPEWLAAWEPLLAAAGALTVDPDGYVRAAPAALGADNRFVSGPQGEPHRAAAPPPAPQQPPQPAPPLAPWSPPGLAASAALPGVGFDGVPPLRPVRPPAVAGGRGTPPGAGCLPGPAGCMPAGPGVLPQARQPAAGGLVVLAGRHRRPAARPALAGRLAGPGPPACGRRDVRGPSGRPRGGGRAPSPRPAWAQLSSRGIPPSRAPPNRPGCRASCLHSPWWALQAKRAFWPPKLG